MIALFVTDPPCHNTVYLVVSNKAVCRKTLGLLNIKLDPEDTGTIRVLSLALGFQSQDVHIKKCERQQKQMPIQTAKILDYSIKVNLMFSRPLYNN